DGIRDFHVTGVQTCALPIYLGLEPAGDNGDWFQRVPLLKATLLAEGAALEIVRDGKRHALAFRDQFVPGVNFNAPESELEAPAVDRKSVVQGKSGVERGRRG